MKKNLTFKEMLALSSMLFGMFFGAGNLIFPVHLGQLAGSNLLPALLGFIITGVGLPLLGVASLGKSRSYGLQDLSNRVGKGYGYFFTCLLYLTIGPCFAIPRCATTAFSVGIEGMLAEENARLILLLFSACFFAIVLFFSLKPNGILTWVGRILTPAFLVFFGALIVIALVNPIASISSVVPDAGYASGSFFNGFLEGYNTMDALASLAFGIVVVTSIQNLGVKEENAIAGNTAKAGIFSCLFMGLIYAGAVVIGAQSRGLFAVSENGGIALSQICQHYFGNIGQIFLAVTVTLACLKTAIGLVTSISEAFAKMFTKSKGYAFWAIGFTVFAFAISNVGLSQIISLSLPVLMFLYPLAITLILLGLFGNLFGHDKKVYICVTAFTLFAAVFDLLHYFGFTAFDVFASALLPFYAIGLGWIVPALIGLGLGLSLHFFVKTEGRQARKAYRDM